MARGRGADQQGRQAALPRPRRLETPDRSGAPPRFPRLRRAGQPLRTAQHGQPGQRPLQPVSGVQQGDHLGHLDQLVGQAGRAEVRHLRHPALAAPGPGRLPRPAGAGRRLLHEGRQAGQGHLVPAQVGTLSGQRSRNGNVQRRSGIENVHRPRTPLLQHHHLLGHEVAHEQPGDPVLPRRQGRQLRSRRRPAHGLPALQTHEPHGLRRKHLRRP